MRSERTAVRRISIFMRNKMRFSVRATVRDSLCASESGDGVVRRH
jgi:hypothetical protein